MTDAGPRPENPEEDVQIEELEPFEAKDAILVVAFPAIGMVSTIAARYLVEALQFRMVGRLRSRYLPPMALVKDHIPHPPARIYAGTCGSGKECRPLVVIVSEFTPAIGLMGVLAERILDWSRQKEIGLVATLEGVHQEDPRDVQVVGVGSNPRARELLKTRKVELLEEGIVAGLSGVLLLEGAARGMDVACLLASTHAEFPDARGAGKLVEILDRFLPGLPIDPEPLYKEAEAIEAQLKAAMARLSRPAQPPVEPAPQPYFG